MAAKPLSDRATLLLECLALARRSIPLDAFEPRRIDGGVLEELVGAGAIAPANGVALILDPSMDARALERSASAEARELAMMTLLGGAVFELDPS